MLQFDLSVRGLNKRKYFTDFFSNLGSSGKKAKIRVDPRSFFIEVASTNMRIANALVVLFTGNQTKL